jgi:NADH-quinone oxidoreductase subunit F
LTRLDGAWETLAAYRSAGGYAALERAVRAADRDAARRALVAEVGAAGLRGRGGAAFPAARKWELAASKVDAVKYVVANGGEHEPGSLKDRHLVARYPHKVLEGIALAAFATGASVAYCYLIQDMTEALASVRQAIDEAVGAGLLGPSAFGGAFSLDVKVVEAPTTYVAGEETAALEVIEGRKAWPRKKPPYPGEAGLFGKPTTVHNVETLAHVPGIVRQGAAWFRGLGVRGGAGTVLCTLDARVNRPGVYEVPMGTTFRELLEREGGGTASGKAVKGFLPALSSRWLAAEKLNTPMTYEAVKEAGSGLGCAGVSFLEEGESVIPRLAEIAQFFMKEQCGQCPPCRMETNTLAMVVKQVKDGTAGDYAAQIDKITAFARGKGNCSLIEMAAAPVQSALALWPQDFAKT